MASSSTLADTLLDTTASISSTSAMPEFASVISSVTATSAAALLDIKPLLHEQQQHHNQITFEIPSHRDLEHINSLHSFNTLLQRIGNVAYDTVASGDLQHPRQHAAATLSLDAGSHAAITSEQISKSVVLDLADLKNGPGSGLERFFAGADMHSIINYLWIGVVTSLVILSVIFIIFSCYFYRKFWEWKKCNKDIRSHLHNDMYPGGRIVTCDNLLNANGQPAEGAAYYQMESPPCYTIATGLPTYDEALHHQQHFSYGMKFVYPSIAAVHHHPAMSGVGNFVASWEKQDASPQHLEKQQQRNWRKVAALEVAPPTYDATAASAAPLLSAAHEKSEAISICMEAPAAGAALTATATAADVKAADSCHDVVVA